MGRPLGSNTLPPPQTREFAERVLTLEDECRRELEQSIQSQQEITLLLSKTNSEIEKISARELQFSNRLRDMEMHLENYGREDLRDLYTTAHEIQMRLFMMRSQAEQLQNRQQYIKEYQEKLRLLLDLLAIQNVPTEWSDQDGDRPMAMRGTTVMALPGTQVIGTPSVMSIIEAQEDERLRISRQIHDGPTQTLTNLILRAEICERLLDRDVEEARTELSGLRAMINSSLQDTRRMIFDLRPMILDDLGLVPTVRRYLTELGRIKGLEAAVSGPEHDIRLTTTMQVALFRFIQVVLNALLIEGAPEHVDISVEREATVARIRIDATSLETDRALVDERLQDQHLRHRLELLNTTLTTTPRANRGISVEMLVPIPEEAVA